MNEEQLDLIAEKIFDFACANRADNLQKDGSPGNPRKVACPYQDLHPVSKFFYRNLAKWHVSELNKQNESLPS